MPKVKIGTHSGHSWSIFVDMERKISNVFTTCNPEKKYTAIFFHLISLVNVYFFQIQVR